MIPAMDMTFTFTPHREFWVFVKEAAALMQQHADEDGGMHNVGVQMLLGYEEGQFTVDDIMAPLR